MAMMKRNGFMPSVGAREKDSCLFVKPRRISIRPEKPRDETASHRRAGIRIPIFVWYYLFGREFLWRSISLDLVVW
jgi:hypothetical protein